MLQIPAQYGDLAVFGHRHDDPRDLERHLRHLRQRPVHIDDDWQKYAPNPTTGLTPENVSVSNTRREAVQFVGIQDASIRNLTIDDSMAERTMDLMVIMSSSDITMDGTTLDQSGSAGFAVAGTIITPGVLSADCR
ncbi:hypothetical protein [Kaistia adipata]|uniref:hypothetical protein n=1 Tax=Kaistia adipata TaxID=166954 RepID=UPI00041E2F0E|nr:hypothetical protein [Kaistia adipata]